MTTVVERVCGSLCEHRCVGCQTRWLHRPRETFTVCHLEFFLPERMCPGCAMGVARETARKMYEQYEQEYE